jgi:hypothetical protein
MLEFAYNWLCSVQRFKFSNYIILAGDNNTYTSLKAFGVNSLPFACCPFVLPSSTSEA